MKEGKKKKHDEEQIAEFFFLVLDNFGEFIPRQLTEATAQLPFHFILPILKKVNCSMSVQFLQQIKTTFASMRLLSEIRSHGELQFDQILVENPWGKKCQR